MKKNELRRLIRLVKKPCAKRVLALLLCAATLFGMIPIIALADAVAISDMTAPDPAEYTVAIDTALDDIGLPTELEITITEEGGSSVRKEPVEWTGVYDKDTAGEYTLTAAFADDTLAFSPMPTIRIIVVEPAADSKALPANADLSDDMQDTSGGTPPSTKSSSTQGTDGNEQQQPLKGILRGEGEDEEKGGVDYSAVCKLIPDRTSYASGESIQFTLNAQYATPGDSSRPLTVKFGIPIPATSPAVQLPMFYMTGTGEYDGVPMYPLSYNGTTVNLYLKTNNSGNRWIEFTLDAGSTVQGTISMILPNGVSNNVPAFTLMPEILSQGDYGTNTFLDGGTTAVNAEFGWNNVNKSANTDNIGVIGAATKDPDRITYSVTADSKSSGLATGRIFTEHYVLSDTIHLSGLHYADGALTQSEAGGISTFSVGGTPVLEILAPLSSLNVKKQAASGKITAFDIRYTVFNTTLGNTDGTAAEMSNLNLSMSLLLSAMQLNPGNEETKVTNTAVFDAYSPYDDHHHSTASHTAYTQDRYLLTKAAYEDEACTQPADLVEDGDFVFYKITATNNSSGDGPFKITDVLPNGLAYISDDCQATVSQSGQTLSWAGLTIPSGNSMTIVLKTQFHAADFTELLKLHNVANLYNANRLLISTSADCTFLTGEVTDSEITYGKTVNKSAARKDENLTYTITVRNSNRNVAKLITVVDKWPGNGIIPTAVTGCGAFKLLDATGSEYTLEQVAANPAIVITHIKCYNVYVPAGGSTRITITGKIKEVLSELVNIVGEGTPGEVSAKTYGVSISKVAYAYNAVAEALGDRLTARTPVSENAIVCYEITITNIMEADIDVLELIDKLPAGLSLESYTLHGVTSSVVLRRGDAYSALTVTEEAGTNHKTTQSFKVATGETVRVYLFAKVSQAAIDESVNNAQRILNAAYVRFNSVQTGDATVNIYTNANTTRKLVMTKWFRFVADYDDTMHYQGTWLQTPAGADVQVDGSAPTATVWNSAYMGYQLQIKNETAGVKEIGIYEIIDSLPPGTEFVGVAKNGTRDAYYYGVAPYTQRDLAGELIFDGETAAWTSGVHSSRIKCTYDQFANRVRIQFVDADNNPAPVSVIPSDNNAQKLFMLIVARVTDESRFASYTNTAEVKVDKDVEASRPGTNGLRTVDEYNYLSATCTANTVPMSPGISKQYNGHYFPQGEAIPPDVGTSVNINPGESLRFTLQVKNQGLDNNGNAANANLQDFTVTDILPAEYTYRANSAMVELNAGYDTESGQITNGTITIPRGSFEPAQEVLPDGRTKLTWTFSGKDRRILCNTLKSHAGFMHIITYDTNWNSKYLPQYGNYTNTASVYHSYRFTAVSSGTPDYGEKSIAASTVVNVFGAAGTAAVKAVTNAANQTVTGDGTNPYVSVAGAGAEVTYTLRVTNATAAAENSQTQSLVIIDELPRAIGDTGVVNRVNRGSEFSVLFGDAPVVSVNKVVNNIEIPVASTAYTVRYGTSDGGLNSTGDWTNIDTGGRITWGKASTGMNAIRIAFLPDYSLAAGEAIIVRFKALAGNDADPDEIAWNSFGYSYKSLAGGKLSEKIYAEPSRVGIHVPGATISITKRVTGDTPPIATQFTFVLKQGGTPLANVKYTLSGDDKAYRTGVDGSFTLTATQTATMSVQPGGGYTVEETLPLPADFTLTGIAAAAAGDGTYDTVAKVFTCKTLADGDSVGAICTNNYAMPRTRDITVRKIWDGLTNPNQPASVTVQLYKGGTAEGAPVTLNAGNLWRHTWQGLSTAENWSVDEPDALPGYTKTITGDSVNGFVITNSYAPTPVVTTEVEAEKVVGGDANPPDETFSFRLTAVSYTAPDGSSDTLTARQMMPLGSINGTKTGSITGAGRVAFGRFTFSKVGIYVYTIREDRGTSAVYTYDGSTYTLTYTVGLDSEGKFTYRLVISKPGVAPNPTAIIFTNTYTRPVGQLTVRKTVTNNGDVNALFTFRFTFSEPTRYAYVKSDGTSGTIATGESLQLKHDQSVTVTIHQGVTYTVIEDAYTRYVPTPADRTSTGTVSATPSTAAFTNRYDPPYVPTLTGDLTVQKRVTGDLGDRNKDFAFKIVFNDPGSYSFTGSKAGTIKSGDTVLLRHGEYVTIVNLPAGTTYSITESGNSGYRVYTSGDAGIIAANGVSVAAFTNSRSKVPLTGDDGALFTGVMLMLISLAGAAVLTLTEQRMMRRRRRARSAG